MASSLSSADKDSRKVPDRENRSERRPLRLNNPKRYLYVSSILSSSSVTSCGDQKGWSQQTGSEHPATLGTVGAHHPALRPPGCVHRAAAFQPVSCPGCVAEERKGQKPKHETLYYQRRTADVCRSAWTGVWLARKSDGKKHQRLVWLKNKQTQQPAISVGGSYCCWNIISVFSRFCIKFNLPQLQ